jgi:RimJ/RimL family protein N-acetyltransferase
MKVKPVTLEGNNVRLEPLTMNHHAALCEVGLDEELWRWGIMTIRTPDDMCAYIESALKDHTKGIALPFATIERVTNKVVGSTRFGNIDVVNRRVEIGWTWIGRHWQRTAINTEAKFLMLSHAFETWKCVRVELKTDSLNERSRNAILRIGAKEEGTLRNHFITHTGRLRHSVYFSIIDSEWNEVKTKLKEMMNRS